MHITLLHLVLLAILTITTTACSEDAPKPIVGTITFLKGDVIVDGNIAKDGGTVKISSQVNTKQNSQVNIKFTDNSLISLSENTSILIDDFNFTGEKSKSFIDINKGMVGFVTGKIAKLAPNNVKYYTETAIIGVRGSSGYIEIGQDGETTVIVDKCCLTVVDNDNKDKIVELNQTGTSTVVTKNAEAPSPPKVDKEIINKFMASKEYEETLKMTNKYAEEGLNASKPVNKRKYNTGTSDETREELRRMKERTKALGAIEF